MFKTLAIGALAGLVMTAGTTRAQAEEAATRDIVDTAVAAGSFKTLATALQAAGLVDTLKGKGPFTVFAPTDEAFTAAGALPSDPAVLSALILRHVVEGERTGFDLQALTSVIAADGSELSIVVEQGLTIVDGQATITVSNVAASNGLAHVVNAVLVPAQ